MRWSAGRPAGPARPVVLALIVAMLAAWAPMPAVAQQVSTKATFSADPLKTWQTDGAVWALASVGDTVFVGGVFNNIRPSGSSVGASGSLKRTNFAAFDAATGEPLSCAPSFTGGSGKVFALTVSPDRKRLYVGGSFTSVSGTGVSNLAAIDPSTCAVLSSTTFRRPSVGGTVRALAATSSGLFVGGEFSAVDGKTRPKFAAFDSAGTLTDAAATFDGTVRAILPALGDDRVYVGGKFENVDGSASRALVAVTPGNGDVVQRFVGWYPTSSAVQALATDGAGRFFAASEGSGFGVFDGRVAGNVSTGAMLWRDSCLGATQAVVAYQGVLYGGHHAHECMLTPGGWREDGFRQHLTGQDVETKEILSTFLPDTNDGIGTAPQGPRALVVTEGGHLWVGGEFTKVNDAGQQGLTRFGKTDSGSVSAPTLTVDRQRAGVNVVNWRAGFDRDEDALTYELYRDGVKINTQTRVSREWVRPLMSFVDTGVSPGQRVTYRIRVIEPDGGNVGALGASTAVTTATTSDPYPKAVLDDAPAFYWRLDEKTETTASTRTGDPYLRATVADASGNAYQGTAERGFVSTATGYTLGGPSALKSGTGSSVSFDGTNGRVAGSFTNDDRPAVAAPGVYSVEFWVKTTTTAGGRLVGFGDRRTGEYVRTQPSDPLANVNPPTLTDYKSNVADRHVYMTNSGALVFGKYSGTTPVTIKTPGTYNNGAWHHVVATSGPSGMRLFVDGSLKASSTNTGTRSYNGYWRVGTDRLSGWSDKPSRDGFEGGIDEFSVFHRELSAAEVLAHYSANGGSAPSDTTPPSPVPSASATASGSTVNVTYGAASDNVGVVGYDIYRTADAATQPSSANRVASVQGNSASESNVPSGTWTYWVEAKDAAGNRSTPVAAAPVTVSSQPGAQTLTVQTKADTYVHGGLSTTNFGSATTMMVDSDPAIMSLLKFGLPAPPTGTTLSSATLRIQSSSNSFAVTTNSVNASMAANDWVESAVTYATRPAVPGPVLGSLAGGVSLSTAYDINLSTSDLLPLLGGDASIALVGTGPDSTQFMTREAGSKGPRLTLTFVPN